MFRRALASFTVIALGVLSIAATACGSSSNSSASSPCDSLTVEQLRSITGIEFRDGRDRSGSGVEDGSSLCVWTAVDDSAEVALSRSSRGSDFDDVVADASTSFGSANAITIKGATQAVEFGDFGVVVMQVGDRVEVLQETLPTSSAGAHLDLASRIASNS